MKTERDEYFEELARDANNAQDVLKATWQNLARAIMGIKAGNQGEAMRFAYDAKEGIELLAKLCAVDLRPELEIVNRRQ